jgi:hypothetical protein
MSEDDKTQSRAQCQVCSNKLTRHEYKKNDHFLAVNCDQVGTQPKFVDF